MKENSFTKEYSLIAKGIAIILMFMHHLFAFPDRIATNNYISILRFNNINIEMLIGAFGKICVAIYLFLSGYGMFLTVSRKKTFTLRDSYKRIKTLYINLWVVFIIFVPIGFIFFNKTFELKEFILNFFGIIFTYNGEWWFFKLYVLLLIIFPISIKFINKGFKRDFINIMAVYIIGKAIKYIVISIPSIAYIEETVIFNDFINLTSWQLIFFIGYLFANFDIYSKVSLKLKEFNINNNWANIIIILLVFGTRYFFRNKVFLDFLLAPIFIFSSVNLLSKLKISKMLILLGKNSSNMWLVHSFFCYAYFQKFIFTPKVSILVLLNLIIVSLITSEVIELVKNRARIVLCKIKSEISIFRYNNINLE